MAVPTALIEAYRRDLAALLGMAQTDLAVLFRRTQDAEALRDLLMDVLPQLVATYGSAAATLAADWYDEARDLEAIGGRFRALPAELPDAGRTDALARWGVSPMFGGTGADAARSQTWGGLHRIIADAGRDTVRVSLAADPAGRGWERRTRTGSCKFCQMLAGRGAVYSADTADFASHDDCNCLAVPVIGADPRPVKTYTPSQRNTSPVPADVLRQYVP